MRVLIMPPVAPADSANQVNWALYQFKWFALSSNLSYYIAVAIGFFIIFISYFFGGGKMNRFKIILSISLGVLAGMFTLPLLMQVAGPNAAPGLVGFFIFLDLIFVATVTCHMYELVVIGSHEAFFGSK
jgi:hypothetical protein